MPVRVYGVGDRGDFAEGAFVGAERGILESTGDAYDDEAGGPNVGFAAQHASHPLDHLASAAAGGEDDGEVGGRDVDAFVEDLGAARTWISPTAKRESTARRLTVSSCEWMAMAGTP